MAKRVRYTDAPPDIEEALLRGEIITDPLPPPDQLRQARINIVTEISLSQKALKVFNNQARNRGVGYQILFNEVLEQYANEHSVILKENPLEAFERSLSEFSDDVFSDGRNQPKIQSRSDVV